MDKPLPPRPKSAPPLIERALRTPFMKRVLWPLEILTTGKRMESDGTPIIKTDRLTSGLLKDFFTNRILAIHMPGFCKPDVCNRMASNILKEKLVNWNIYDPSLILKDSDVEVFGNPFNMARKTDETWERYFSSAIATSEKLRSMALPYASPFDQFRIMVDEHWEHGMTVGRYKHHKMPPGLVRVMHDNDTKRSTTSLGCHFDSPPLLSDSSGKFSVNIYIKQPESGGHLYIWNPRITTFRTLISNWDAVKTFLLASNYQNEDVQIRFQKLLPPPMLIEIGQGDAVLFNTGRPHAVVPFHGGPRVSLQAFLNYRKNHPIGIWA